MAKTVLIVGASRGLGLGLVRGYLDEDWDVIATSRGSDRALREFAASAGHRLRLETLDVTDATGLAALKRTLAGITLDVLFVSAGVMGERDGPAADVQPEEFARVLVTNALSPLKIIEALDEGVPRDGAIVAMTSTLGSVAGNTGGGTEVYRASKAALNTLLRSYASRHPQRAIIAMHPGWVRTDMGGANATVSVEDSARGMVTAIAARSGHAGCVFIDYRGQTIPW